MVSRLHRRGFLGMLAGAGLGVLAARTGLAQSVLAIAEPELEPIEISPFSNAVPGAPFDESAFDDVARRLTDPNAWFLVTGRDQDGNPVQDEIPRFYRAANRHSPPFKSISAVYGSSGL